MKASYYPGCSLHGTGREYDESAHAVCNDLNVELKELDGWICCGASSAHSTNDILSIALPARNLEIAEKAGLDLIVPCAACFQRLKVAEKKFAKGSVPEAVSANYNGEIHISHLLDFISDVIGEKAILEKVKKSLKGLSPVCYYGCLIVRPPQVTDAKNPENPQNMDSLLCSLGANVKGWSYKTDCCGGSLMLSRPDLAKTLVKRLLDMAEEAGADCIVTVCPLCQSNLDTRQKELSQENNREYNLPIFYFTELMSLAFENPAVVAWLGRHLTDPLPLLNQKGLI